MNVVAALSLEGINNYTSVLDQACFVVAALNLEGINNWFDKLTNRLSKLVIELVEIALSLEGINNLIFD